MSKLSSLSGLNQLYVADPATCLASDSVLGTLFISENSLFIQLGKKTTIITHKCCKY